MRMKRIWMLPALAAAMLATACSSDDDGAAFGPGQLQFTCTAADRVADLGTRAAENDPDGKKTVALPASVLPAGDDFRLHLTGTYDEEVKTNGQTTTETRTYDQSWETLRSFHVQHPNLYCTNAAYTAVLSYGDPAAEGPGAAYFEGSVTGIAPAVNKTTKVPVSARLANSCFRLRLDEWMRSYYTDIQLTVSTEEHSFAFTAETATDDNVIFVRSGRLLTLAGTAVIAQTGKAVTFEEKAIGGGKKTAPETMHTIALTQGKAGAGSIAIVFDETFTEVDLGETELNPEL